MGVRCTARGTRMEWKYDAVIVGSGPNGLAAAITLARTGRKVVVLEEQQTLGGGVRSAELTLPGFVHDVCSAIYPMAAGSAFLRGLPLEAHGLKWIQPSVPLAHPFEDGTTAFLHRSLDETAQGLGEDGDAYARMMRPFVAQWEELFAAILPAPHLPRHPLLMARFGLKALQSVEGLAKSRFRGSQARGLLAGLGGHSFLPFDEPASAAIALVLGIAGHAVGWPIVEGGSQNLTRALASYFASLGGEVRLGCKVRDAGDLPPSRSVFLDLAIPQVLSLVGDRLPFRYRQTLESWKLGPGVFKIDFALNAPVPWKDPAVGRAGTVHLGGTLEEIAAHEKAVSEGRGTDRPYLLMSQPTTFDPSRAPAGKHTAWAYCHVPRGSDIDMTEPILKQIERFAPGFRSTIAHQHVMTPQGFEHHNASLPGGDISGGLPTLAQVARRPVVIAPYALPLSHWYLCSSSTPPGSGVHGYCGFNSAQFAMRDGV